MYFEIDKRRNGTTEINRIWAVDAWSWRCEAGERWTAVINDLCTDIVSHNVHFTGSKILISHVWYCIRRTNSTSSVLSNLFLVLYGVVQLNMHSMHKKTVISRSTIRNSTSLIQTNEEKIVSRFKRPMTL